MTAWERLLNIRHCGIHIEHKGVLITKVNTDGKMVR